jgi:hypothetical protein
MAQTLQVESISSHRGQTVDLGVALDGAEALQPLALQFEIQYAPKNLELDFANSTAGDAAKSAGKNLTCAGRWKKQPNSYLVKCIVAGSKEPMRNGKVALLRFKVPLSAEYGKHKVSVEDAQAVTPAVKAVKLKKSEGVITVSRKTD